MRTLPSRTIVVYPGSRLKSVDNSSLIGPGSEEAVWIDLPGTDRTVLDRVQQALGFSPEVITYCLLHYHSAKVIHTDSTLFLVTFVALPHSSSLFTLRELKLCANSRFLLTTHCFPGPAPRPLKNYLSGLEGGIGFGTGHLLCLILEKVVESHERVVRGIQGQGRGAKKIRERLWQARQTHKLVHFLHDQQVLLQKVEPAGRKLFSTDEGIWLKGLGERLGMLAGVAREATGDPEGRRPLAGG